MALDTRKPAGPEEIWKILRKTSKLQKESKKEMKKLRAAQKAAQRETGLLQKETEKRFQETEEQIKKTSRVVEQIRRDGNRRMDRLEELFTGQWGKLMESLVAGDLIRLFQERRIQVQRTLPNVTGRHADGKVWELDIVAVNGEEIIVVEVKTTLRVEDIRSFIDKNLKRIRTMFPEYSDKKVYGAIAYLRTRENTRIMALKQGLFVIRATGNSASIINAQDFRPRCF